MNYTVKVNANSFYEELYKRSN